MKICNRIAVCLMSVCLISIPGFFFSDEVQAMKTDGAIQLIPNDDLQPPVDPEHPEDIIEPEPAPEGTHGPLSLDFASSLDFGTNKISTRDEVYVARAQKIKGTNRTIPNYVQVTDNRGTNKGWTLTVRQEGHFKATESTLNSTLTGTVLTLVAPVVNSNSSDKEKVAPTVTDVVRLDGDGEEVVVMAAAENKGAGLWTNAWGVSEKATEKNQAGETVTVDVNKAITLDVPGKTPKDSVKYETKLIWKVSEVPANN